MTVKVFAPAKVNLTLHVTGQRGDGYHQLDSLVVFAGVGDMVSILRNQNLTLSISGTEAAGVPVDDSNSVIKAAQYMDVDDAAFALEKHLPTAAGLGGGTADAAATLRAIARSYNEELPDDTLSLGADVSVCLRSHATRMSGIGEVLQDVSKLPEIWTVLVNPRLPLATIDVFKRLKHKDNAPMPAEIPKFAGVKALAQWLAQQRNDLQEPAIEMQPAISTVLKALQATQGHLFSRMSGSGASCFALYENGQDARLAADKIHADHPDWWVRDTMLV